jgi:hypothetical protein
MLKDHYKTLGLKPKATKEEIIAKRDQLVIDGDLPQDELQDVHEAYSVLSNDTTRPIYDEKYNEEKKPKGFRALHLKRENVPAAVGLLGVVTAFVTQSYSSGGAPLLLAGEAAVYFFMPYATAKLATNTITNIKIIELFIFHRDVSIKYLRQEATDKGVSPEALLKEQRKQHITKCFKNAVLCTAIWGSFILLDHIFAQQRFIKHNGVYGDNFFNRAPRRIGRLVGINYPSDVTDFGSNEGDREIMVGDIVATGTTTLFHDSSRQRPYMVESKVVQTVPGQKYKSLYASNNYRRIGDNVVKGDDFVQLKLPNGMIVYASNPLGAFRYADQSGEINREYVKKRREEKSLWRLLPNG